MQLNYQLIGKRIQETRKLRKVTQAELAERTDLSISYISFIESAKKNVSLDSLHKIAYVMDTSVQTLLCGNQGTCGEDYQNDILHIMQDCTNYEKRIIFEQVLALKSSLRANEGLR